MDSMGCFRPLVWGLLLNKHDRRWYIASEKQSFRPLVWGLLLNKILNLATW